MKVGAGICGMLQESSWELMKMGDSHYVPKPPQKSDGETQANRLSKSIIKTYLNQKASDFICF